MAALRGDGAAAEMALLGDSIEIFEACDPWEVLMLLRASEKLQIEQSFLCLAGEGADSVPSTCPILISRKSLFLTFLGSLFGLSCSGGSSWHLTCSLVFHKFGTRVRNALSISVTCGSGLKAGQCGVAPMPKPPLPAPAPAHYRKSCPGPALCSEWSQRYP